MTDRMTKMVTGLLPDGTLIRACEITFGHLEKQADRIKNLEAALIDILKVPRSEASWGIALVIAHHALKEGKDE